MQNLSIYQYWFIYLFNLSKNLKKNVFFIPNRIIITQVIFKLRDARVIVNCCLSKN